MGGSIRRGGWRAAGAVRAAGFAAACVAVACLAVAVGWTAGAGSAQASGSGRVTSSRAASSRVPSRHVTTSRVTINGVRRGPVFDGLGAADAGGAMGRLLIDYPATQRTQILDYLFGPGGADLQILKLEIGGDSAEADGALPSVEHTRGQIDCQSGYEWWLAEQAVARDPHILLAGLQWSAPGWVGSVWNSDDVGYVIDWLNCARSHGLRVSYLGGWNERGFRMAWFEQLRRTLNADGYRYVKLMAADTFSDRTVAAGRRVYDPAQTWYVARVAAAHPAFRAALGVIAAHDTCGGPTRGFQCESTRAARRLGLPLWESELGAMHGPTAPADLARSVNGGFIQAGITGYVQWPMITAMPPGLLYAGHGLVDASEPQAGHYAVSPITWAIAQTTQFTEPGWRHVNGASGYLGNSGTYAAYESPDHSDWSLVTENAGRRAFQRPGPQRITVHLAGGLGDGTVRVWSTNLDSSRPATWFVHRPDLHPSRATFSYTIQPGYAVTFTSTSGQSRLSARPPAAAPMRLSYRATPDASNEPWGLATQEGAFVYQPCLGGQAGQCIQQQTTSKPVFWSPAMTADPPPPYALTGAPGWASYTVSARVLLPTASASAGLIGRFSHQGGDPVQFDGYQFDLHGDGSWRLARNRSDGPAQVLASGRVAGIQPGTWHPISLRLSGRRITASVDGHAVGAVTSSAYGSGLAGIESSYASVQFTDLTVS